MNVSATSSTRLSPITLLPVLTFLASAWLAAVLFYQDLPNAIPTHWSSPFDGPNGYTEKPWGPFVFPILMTAVWLGRRVVQFLSLPRHRAERFPGAFDFKIMLTIGLLFVIWNLVIAQSVPWLRAAAVPASVALIVAGSFLATLPFAAVASLGGRRFWRHEADWLRARWTVSLAPVAAGAGILAGLVLG